MKNFVKPLIMMFVKKQVKIIMEAHGGRSEVKYAVQNIAVENSNVEVNQFEEGEIILDQELIIREDQSDAAKEVDMQNTDIAEKAVGDLGVVSPHDILFLPLNVSKFDVLYVESVEKEEVDVNNKSFCDSGIKCDGIMADVIGLGDSDLGGGKKAPTARRRSPHKNLLFATPARQRTYLLLLPPEAGREPQPKSNSLHLPTLPRMRNSRRRTSRAILEATLMNPLTSSPSQDPLSLPLSLSLLKAFSGQGSSQRTISLADQFKSWENCHEHRPGYELADIYHPEVTKGF
ncbi:hypothetical protein MA16_Dca023537 [Dendrobium catenatum]|uniref:Uncharacterized protein n=1 Tax=Dendrobium catenatum TaxID=906689 RepID=A0A2I0XBA3_9ASPA|nr:hypothetical protein MA16_Dca023537 [Dendrobium catenatum]